MACAPKRRHPALSAFMPGRSTSAPIALGHRPQPHAEQGSSLADSGRFHNRPNRRKALAISDLHGGEHAGNESRGRVPRPAPRNKKRPAFAGPFGLVQNASVDSLAGLDLKSTPFASAGRQVLGYPIRDTGKNPVMSAGLTYAAAAPPAGFFHQGKLPHCLSSK